MPRKGLPHPTFISAHAESPAVYVQVQKLALEKKAGSHKGKVPGRASYAGYIRYTHPFFASRSICENEGGEGRKACK